MLGTRPRVTYARHSKRVYSSETGIIFRCLSLSLSPSLAYVFRRGRNTRKEKKEEEEAKKEKKKKEKLAVIFSPLYYTTIPLLAVETGEEAGHYRGIPRMHPQRTPRRFWTLA